MQTPSEFTQAVGHLSAKWSPCLHRHRIQASSPHQLQSCVSHLPEGHPTPVGDCLCQACRVTAGQLWPGKAANFTVIMSYRPSSSSRSGPQPGEGTLLQVCLSLGLPSALGDSVEFLHNLQLLFYWNLIILYINFPSLDHPVCRFYLLMGHKLVQYLEGDSVGAAP